MAANKTEKKVPQDHKPVHVTVGGVDVTVEPKLFDDLELIMAVDDMQHAESDDDKMHALVVVFRRLFPGQWRDVIRGLRVDGKVSIEAAVEAITNVMKASAPNS